MKRIMLMILLVIMTGIVFPSNVNAQVYTYRTFQYAYKQVNAYGNWSDWSDWEESNMTMVINYNTDVVTIFSPKTQRYRITEFIRNFTDSSGGKQIEFAFVDQDGDKGHMRLRIETNGNSQLYIEYSNVIWCYNVRRTN